jgi:hypothetical protein
MYAPIKWYRGHAIDNEQLVNHHAMEFHPHNLVDDEPPDRKQSRAGRKGERKCQT